MASIALTVVGSVFGGPLGASLGAAVGGLIDQALFSPTIQGPRLSDLKVTSSAFGSPIPLIYGPTVRTSGNIIWTTGLVEKKHKKGGKGGPTVKTYTYSTSLAVLVCQGRVGNLKKVWANSKLIYDSTATPTGPVYSSLTWYTGTTTQNPDPVMESYLGAGNVPGYRGLAYCVIDGFQLADFGNSVPNLEFEIEGYAPDGTVLSSVASWVLDIASRANLTGLDISTTQIAAIGKGYAIGRDTNAFAAIEPLSVAYNFDVTEQQGSIRCIDRGAVISLTIPRDEMGASTGLPQNEAADPFRVKADPPLNMPREVTVTFFDSALDYQENSQRASRQLGNSANNITREIPVVLTATEGRRAAELLLRNAWSGRRTTKFNLSDRYRNLSVGQVFGATFNNRIAPFKVMRSTRGNDGIVEIEARMTDPYVYQSSLTGIEGILPTNSISESGVTRLVLMDAPILRDADDNAGFYWAAGRQNTGWRGALIYRSVDSGVNYQEMNDVAISAAMGDVASALPSGPADYWDYGNSIIVEMYDETDQLESVTETELFAGANACWLGPADGQGGEIIQFLTATPIGYGMYQLTDLLRGRQGTDFAIGTHGANEVFVLLEADTLGRTDYGASDWDKDRSFKPVSVLTTLAETTGQTFENTGEGKRPYSPVHVEGVRDVSDNLTITWIRRSRLSAPGLGNGPVPLGEETEAYEIDVYSGATVVRTISATSETASYSAADQTSDGLTPGDPVDIIVYQLSASRGRGHGRSATI